jgi:hypothetical protein
MEIYNINTPEQLESANNYYMKIKWDNYSISFCSKSSLVIGAVALNLEDLSV